MQCYLAFGRNRWEMYRWEGKRDIKQQRINIYGFRRRIYNYKPLLCWILIGTTWRPVYSDITIICIWGLRRQNQVSQVEILKLPSSNVKVPLFCYVLWYVEIYVTIIRVNSRENCSIVTNKLKIGSNKINSFWTSIDRNSTDKIPK